MMKTNRIGIMGLGFIGGAALKYFEQQTRRGQKIYKYDKYKNIGSVAEVNQAEVIFICVPTPFHPQKGFDLSAVESAVRALIGRKIVVIRSTVIPGTTAALQKKFFQHKFLFNPEFLRQVSAYQDFINPDRQIIGYTKQSKAVAKAVLNILPHAPFEKIMLSAEAEVVKYMGNAFLAMKVVFANEFYDLCKNLGLDYDVVKKAAGEDRRITPSHLNVSQDGYRGYGGGCFPKDVNALLEFAKIKKVKMELLEAMRKVNRGLLKESGVSETDFLKPKFKI